MDPIEKYLDSVETKKVQAPVEESLYDRVNKYREDKDLSWTELLTAMFKRLLAEAKR